MSRPSRLLRVSLAAVALCSAAPSGVRASSGGAPPVTVPSANDSAGGSAAGDQKERAVEPEMVRANVSIGSVVVSIEEQRAFVYSRSRRLITSLPISTGLGDTTPTGSFRVFSKSAQAYYTPAPNERMKWMVRFTKGRGGDNIGFHGIPYKVTAAGDVPFHTPVGLAPSSHGCVRMRVRDARWLFDNITVGTPVRVVRSRGN
ncbi:MAG: L,D-transpeptidase [Actinomycetota bacterium]